MADAPEQNLLTCPDCGTPFPDEAALKKHRQGSWAGTKPNESPGALAEDVCPEVDDAR